MPRPHAALPARADAALLALPLPLAEFLAFGVKQAWACLFGGAMLAAILATNVVWQPEWVVARYDALFLFAVGLQGLLLATGMEKPEEARVIALFHLVGTIMELFKTEVGSWAYPEDNLLRIGGVPLFSGFMYACVGSYVARATRLFDLRYDAYPPLRATYALAALVYANFFTHHHAPDIRHALFALTALLFWRTRVIFTPLQRPYAMPLLMGFALVALFIWIAENLGTFGAAWVYPDQAQAWTFVSAGKLGSWLLLMIVSFVLVTLVHRPRTPDPDALEP